MEEYKGLFFKKNTEKEFFEGGAHFRYKDLLKILTLLFKKNLEIEEMKKELLIAKNNTSNTNNILSPSLIMKYKIYEENIENNNNQFIDRRNRQRSCDMINNNYNKNKVKRSMKLSCDNKIVKYPLINPNMHRLNDINNKLNNNQYNRIYRGRNLNDNKIKKHSVYNSMESEYSNQYEGYPRNNSKDMNHSISNSNIVDISSTKIKKSNEFSNSDLRVKSNIIILKLNKKMGGIELKIVKAKNEFPTLRVKNSY